MNADTIRLSNRFEMLSLHKSSLTRSSSLSRFFILSLAKQTQLHVIHIASAGMFALRHTAIKLILLSTWFYLSVNSMHVRDFPIYTNHTSPGSFHFNTHLWLVNVLKYTILYYIQSSDSSCLCHTECAVDNADYIPISP